LNHLIHRLSSPDPKTRQEAQREYHEWLTDPVTTMIVTAMRDQIMDNLGMALPNDAAYGNEIASSQRLWALNGMKKAHELVTELDRLCDPSAKDTNLNQAHDAAFYTGE
jgi:hypothetical protein